MRCHASGSRKPVQEPTVNWLLSLLSVDTHSRSCSRLPVWFHDTWLSPRTHLCRDLYGVASAACRNQDGGCCWHARTVWTSVLVMTMTVTKPIDCGTSLGLVSLSLVYDLYCRCLRRRRGLVHTSQRPAHLQLLLVHTDLYDWETQLRDRRSILAALHSVICLFRTNISFDMTSSNINSLIEEVISQKIRIEILTDILNHNTVSL